MKVYHTGRVQIGLAYDSYRPPYHDRDALRIQNALLGVKPRRLPMTSALLLILILILSGAFI